MSVWEKSCTVPQYMRIAQGIIGNLEINELRHAKAWLSPW